MPFSRSVREESLVKSHRYCCVCHKFAGRDVNVHHIIQESDGGPNTLENSIALCFRCHSEAGHYNPKHPLGTKYSPEELRRHRDQWWDQLSRDPIGIIKPPVEDILSLRFRVQAPSQTLITRAKTRWNYPDGAQTVRLEICESMQPSREMTRSIDHIELISLAREGTNMFLVGEAGVGKTTTLIALSEKLLYDSDSPIPIFVDAAGWALSGKTLLEHIASFSTFVNADVGTKELSSLNEAGEMLIVINGWNEIGANAQSGARERLQQFISGSSAPRLIVATRSATDTLGVPNPKKVTVRGFTWEEQQAFIRQSLPRDSASSLLTSLRANSKLRSVTKNPLVLNGVILLHKSGRDVPDNLYDLLAAIVDSIEVEGARAAVLKSAPLRGCHRAFLESIADAMNRSALTLMPEADARRVVHETGRKLVDRGRLTQHPEPSDVLEVLCSQHLLHRNEDSALRFAHQRFQEFFSACVVLSHLETELTIDNEREAFRTDILNCPFWEDAIELVAYKLAGDQSRKAQAGLLIELSLSVDLSYASEIGGMVGTGIEGGVPWQNLRNAIEQMHNLAAPEARQYALNCAASTRSPEFAPLLWTLLESEDQQIRLKGYRLSGGLTVQQLGPNAFERMAQWADERRKESVWEFANRPENFEFIERLAHTETITTVRAAAIGALDFYVANDSAFDAWRNAPDVVKEEDSALSVVLKLWRSDNIALTNELIALARRSSEEVVKQKVGLRLLCHAEEIGAEAARKALLDQDKNRGTSAALVAFLKTADPEFLKNLTLERISQGRRVKSWMHQVLASLPGNERDDFVLTVLERLSAMDNGNLDEAVAEGVTEPLVERLFNEGLRLVATLWSDRRADEAVRRRFRAIERLLSHVPASFLFQAVLRVADSCSYDDLAWIAEILDRRASPEDSGWKDEDTKAHWQPDAEDLDDLIEAASGKRDNREISSCRLEAHLVSLASKTDPERYFEHVLEGTRRHAHAYNAFYEALQQWIARRGRSTRPNNPPYGLWFVEALRRCGFDAVPRLLAMESEPGAQHIVPEALVAIVCEPWKKKREVRFLYRGNFVDDHQSRRSARRVFQQPDGAYQPITDEVAKFLVRKIEAITATDRAPIDVNDPNQSPQAYSLWNICKLLARVPSMVGLPNLQAILLREDAQIYPYLDIAECIIGQGGTLPSGSLNAIKSIWQRETAKDWIDDNTRYAISRLAILHFFVEPPEAGLSHLRELLSEWPEIALLWDLVDKVRYIPTKEALAVLTELLPRCGSRNDCEERIINAIASNPAPDTANALLKLIEVGLLSKHSRQMFRFEDPIAQRLKQNAESDEEFMQRLLTVLETKADEKHEALICYVLGNMDDPRARMLVCRYLDEQAFPKSGHLAADILKGRFSRQIQSMHGEGWYEVHPQANPPLRQHLFTLASSPGAEQNRARALLMALEKSRIESGRPAGEKRHPAIELGIPWPTCLYTG